MLNLLTEDEVALQLNVSLASLRRWRLERRGPRFVKLGSLVRYQPQDVETWLGSLPSGGSISAPASLRVSRSA
jgi:excisionase family DNA binding protein